MLWQSFMNLLRGSKDKKRVQTHRRRQRRHLELEVLEGRLSPALSLSPTTLPTWAVNQVGYSQTITASGGTAPYTFGETGTLPTGLGLNSSTGVLSGTPSATGSYTFTVTATDSLGASGSQTYTVVIFGTWTTISPPSTIGNIGTMLLLTDGTVIMQQGGDSYGWYKLTPDVTGSYINGGWTTLASMSVSRLYGGYVVLPNGNVIVMGGEESFSGGNQNTGEMYDPATNIWSPIESFPEPEFGDAPLEVLANGNVLGGYKLGPETFIYNPQSNQWSMAGSKLRQDPTLEEGWIKLPDGSILSYDIAANNAAEAQGTTTIAGGQVTGVTITNPGTGLSNGTVIFEGGGGTGATGTVTLDPTGHVTAVTITNPGTGYTSAPVPFFPNTINTTERYEPATNSWVDAGTVPVPLTDMYEEMGPGLLLPDGRVFPAGAFGGNTALYTPATNTWAQGPSIPGGMIASDAPGCVLPSGDVIFAADTPTSQNPSGALYPTQLFDFNPSTDTITPLNLPGNPNNLPATLIDALDNTTSSKFRMLVLPSGDMLISVASSSAVWDYNPNASPQASWRPTISSVVSNPDGTYTLTGTQLNGLDEGASYGDDAQMASNYPIVELTSNNGVFFAKTFNWVSQVATGSNVVSTDFTLPSDLPGPGLYSLTVVANGIASAPLSFVVTAHIAIATRSLPSGQANVAYSQAIDATDGSSSSLTFSTTSGTLPPGMTLSTVSNSTGVNTGVLSGTPTVPGSYTFTVTATDTAGSASETYTLLITGAYLSLPTTGFVGTAGTTTSFTGFPISINKLEDFASTDDVGLASASFAVTFPAGVFNFPIGGNLAGADVNLASIPLSDTATAHGTTGGANDWTLFANSPVDGQLNITLTAKSGDNITSDTGGGSLVMINFPVLSTYNPLSTTAEQITVIAADGTFPTSIIGNNAQYSLQGQPPYSGSITINPPVAISARTLAIFNGTITGGVPLGGLIDSSGNLFGTTSTGGASGDGTVFELQASTGVIITLASFNGSNGASPTAGLIEDSSGNLFGTTRAGDSSNGGTIFEVALDSGTVTTLAAFTGSNGFTPDASVIADGSGNLFGTTFSGGEYNVGTVFELQKSGSSYTLTTLAAFNGSNGANPAATLVEDSSGDLFGTTSAGGPNNDGTVFELQHGSSTITTLAAFNGSNGNDPLGDLVEDSGGNLFGTTQYGGAYYDGTVFELTQGSGTISSLATFNGTNGAYPTGGVVEDRSGSLLGTAFYGGADGNGTVFEILPGSGTLNTIAALNVYTGNPYGSLIEDKSGNVFGTTSDGGLYGDGTLFEVASPQVSWTVGEAGFSLGIGASGGTGTLTFSTTGTLPPGLSINSSTGVLSGTPSQVGTYTFTVTATDTVGASGSQQYTVTINPPVAITTTSLPTSPLFNTLASFSALVRDENSGGAKSLGALIEDGNGNLFGTTSVGGAYGYGAVFEITAGNSVITTLASFDNTDGALPFAGLIEDSSGNLFGTTYAGGADGDGTVFELEDGSGTITTLATFNDTNGAAPFGGLIEDSNGDLFGTTAYGGFYGAGTVFELQVQGGTRTLTTLASFSGYGSDGGWPAAGVIEDSSGNLFGTASAGGTDGYGTVFEVKADSGTITTLVSFNGSNGEYPSGSLLMDNSGNLFGTTYGNGVSVYGTVFKLAAGSGTITTLATFNKTNGAFPLGNLVEDSSGDLFGTTSAGGGSGDGTVFELPAGSGSITTLVTFTGTNGDSPQAGLIIDGNGNLYGTTAYGGTSGTGTVFVVGTQANGLVGTAFSQTIQATGGTGTLTFSLAGALPTGLTLSSTGVLSGTPTSSGAFTFTVTATDAVGASASLTYTIIITP